MAAMSYLKLAVRQGRVIVRDRLRAHRSKLVREHVEAQRGARVLEFLPAYAAERNPVGWHQWCPSANPRLAVSLSMARSTSGDGTGCAARIYRRILVIAGIRLRSRMTPNDNGTFGQQ